ncbi:MAG: 2-C-methyl-D-erythritol 4-phosphate cytidylyltransferase [Lachnospiraceae bacterium]|nr:2-C-methyl-D-erythritol 4-phosphate cytidylyltransferase [Lachnospiraceae bacterium]
MNSPVKKQYMEIADHPVLYYTIKAFEESLTDRIVIVTGSEEIDFVKKEIVEKYGFKKVLCVCEGGRERFDSVYEGIKKAKRGGAGYVLIHDGVRMLVTSELINRCIENVRACDACVAAVPAKDTLKECGTDIGDAQRSEKAGMIVRRTIDRKSIYQIQTPQCFEISLIIGAFEKMYGMPGAERDKITDDSMVVEIYSDHKVTVVEGDYKNIKITTPEDLELAEFWLKRNREFVAKT